MNFSYYKYCMVPQCKSTSIKTPNKLFIYVPNDAQIRKKWLKLAKRDDAPSLSTDSRMYFCEDHFDLPNDMVNYMQYHIMGTVSQVRMKTGCIPSRFECQEDQRKRTCSSTKQPYIGKKQRMMTITECPNQSEETNTPSSSLKDISVPSANLSTVQKKVPEILSNQMADKSVQSSVTHKFRSKAVQTKVNTKDQASPLKLSLICSSISPFQAETILKSRPSLSDRSQITTNILIKEEHSDSDNSINKIPSVSTNSPSPSVHSSQVKSSSNILIKEEHSDSDISIDKISSVATNISSPSVHSLQVQSYSNILIKEEHSDSDNSIDEIPSVSTNSLSPSVHSSQVKSSSNIFIKDEHSDSDISIDKISSVATNISSPSVHSLQVQSYSNILIKEEHSDSDNSMDKIPSVSTNSPSPSVHSSQVKSSSNILIKEEHSDSDISIDKIPSVAPDIPSPSVHSSQVQSSSNILIKEEHSDSDISTYKIPPVAPDIPSPSVHSSQVQSSSNTLIKEEHSDSDISIDEIPSVSTNSPSPSVHSSQVKSPADCIEFIKEDRKIEAKETILITLKKIEKKPLLYIGVPSNCYYLIDIIKDELNIPKHHLLLCLNKIRLDTKFNQLADDYGMTASFLSKIFFNNIPLIASVMRPFIVSLDSEIIKRTLPMSFRHKYHNVCCIIDCFEIEVQKPSKAVNQAVTWSDDKKANTMKYLISCTPNGLVNYISPGFGGRTTDTCLVESCDFDKTLKSGMCVMADRGFKHAEQYLRKSGTTLVRPPSVATGVKMSESEAKLTKQIASLRIHKERVIQRLREFYMLKPHSCINFKFVKNLDDIMIIACALINLQDSLIK